jgi:NDP-4-keto-2,6-dideoxyhexose 3-C-methyltransferase
MADHIDIFQSDKPVVQEVPLVHLGRHYVSDFLDPDESSDDREKFSLDIYLDPDNAAVRLGEVAPRAQNKYWYRSSTEPNMPYELGKIVQEITERINYKPGDIWLDIACNDGTLLQQVPNELVKVGIDPGDDSFYAESSKHATVVQDYFSQEAWNKSGYTEHKAKIITCIGMFHDLADPVPFIKDLHEVVDDNGVIVLQLSYAPLMIQQMAFDNICHEHVYHHSLTSMIYMFSKQNMMVVDASLHEVNGGSLRVYIVKQTANPSLFSTEQLRQVCRYRTESMLKLEEEFDICQVEHWHMFSARLEKMKIDTLGFIHHAKAEGKTVYGYDASTQGNTLLQYFGLTNKDIVAIADQNENKWGKKTVGSEIPICSEQAVRDANPDYMLILSWQHVNKFMKREQAWLQAGGTFLVACPEFRLITKADL